MKDAIRYTVTVKAVFERLTKVTDVWRVVAQEPSGAVDKNGAPVLKDVYGYLPPVEKMVAQELQVYEQTVDKPIDFVKLVQVVNGVAS